MISEFLSRLTAPRPEPLTDGDARLALAALLVRVAQSDGVYETAERETIARILSTRYDLDATACEALMQSAEKLEREAPDTVRFTRAIKDTVAYEDRLAVVTALWKVALADGEREAEEDALLRVVVSLLGISDPDSARARHQAQGAA